MVFKVPLGFRVFRVLCSLFAPSVINVRFWLILSCTYISLIKLWINQEVTKTWLKHVRLIMLTECTNSNLATICNKVAIFYFFYPFWIVKRPSIYRNNNVLKSRNLLLTTQISSCGREPRSTLDFKKVERYIPQPYSRKSP